MSDDLPIDLPTEPDEAVEPAKADPAATSTAAPPEDGPTPEATRSDANDPVDKALAKEKHFADEAEEDIARASNSIVGKLEQAQGHINDLRQKGHELEGWVVEFEQWVHTFIGKAKSALAGKTPPTSAGGGA